MATNAGNNFANQAFGSTNKGNGYLPFNEILGNNQIGGAMDTTNDSAQIGSDKWAQFFGTPPYSTFQRDNYADLGHENYQLPTAYIGRNLHIEKVLNVSIASQDDFYTRVLLPWKVYDGMRITFSKWSGFDHMMHQVPEEVPAPQIQTRFEQGEAYQQRYGLAFKMEHGFQRTEMGRQAYAMNLAIITQAVLRTVYARIMQVLVTNRNWLSVVAAKTFPSAAVQAREISKCSVNSFGCIQKNTFGLDLILNQIQKLFREKMLAQPDSVVIPHGTMAYLQACKPEHRVYALCGQLAERLSLKTERDLLTNIYNNNYQVFEHKPMTVSDDSNEVNMLVREREVGNVFRLFRNTIDDYGYEGPAAIKIIDHDRQRWATLSLVDCLKHTGAFMDDGNVAGDGPLNGFIDGLIVSASIPTIGSLTDEALQESTLRDALRSIRAWTQRNKGGAGANGAFKTIVSGTPPPMPPARTSNLVSNPIAAPVAASTADVAAGIQGSVLAAIGSSVTDAMVAKATSSGRINSALETLASATDGMTDSQRYGVTKALEDDGVDFKASKAALKKFLKNTSDADATGLEDAYVKAVSADFRKNWRSISTRAKTIAADVDARAAQSAQSNVVIGGDVAKAFAGGLTGEDRKIMQWYLDLPLTLQTIQQLDDAGIVTPFGVFIMRPFQSFAMGSAIVMASGEQTGFTAVGNSDFQLGDNVTNKTHLGHFTFYFEPVVHEPNHIMIARDIAFMGYNGGAGTQFFQDWSQVGTTVRSATGERPSLLAAIAFHHENHDDYIQDPMSITGRFSEHSILNNLLTTKQDKHYATCDWYRTQLTADSAFSTLDAETADAGDGAFFNTGTNYIMYQGLQADRGPSREFNSFTTNTGHLGDSEATDSSLAWAGHLAFKTSVSYHRAGDSVSLMSRTT